MFNHIRELHHSQTTDGKVGEERCLTIFVNYITLKQGVKIPVLGSGLTIFVNYITLKLG